MKNKFWDYIAWLILIGIAIWLVLKVFGILSTPIIIEYAPLFGAVYLVGWAMHKLDRATDDIKNIKDDIKDINSEARETEKRIGSIERTTDLIKKNCPLLLKNS